MCGVCGCGHIETSGEAPVEGRSHDHHGHGHHHGSHDDHSHVHDHSHGDSRWVRVEQDILSKNNAYAAENRRLFIDRGMLVLNLVSSPGSGKTSLLTRTLRELSGELSMSVIEGDQQTPLDAERIRETGTKAVQINTGKGCHLDAHMVGHAVHELQPEAESVLFIENVGNLVCPAGFDLGEAHKVVVLSVTEGEDKPLKYPGIFHRSSLMVLNKIDLLPYVPFNMDNFRRGVETLNPGVEVFPLSCRTGEGLDKWLDWVNKSCLERA